MCDYNGAISNTSALPLSLSLGLTGRIIYSLQLYSLKKRSIISYTDDILLSADCHELCQAAFVFCLQHLSVIGFKVSLQKVQYCLIEVQYLGIILAQGQRQLF